jgi:hypothetical protein
VSAIRLVIAVVGTPSASDIAIKNHWVAAGHTVNYFDSASAAGTPTEDIVVLAPASNPNANAYDGVTVPVYGLGPFPDSHWSQLAFSPGGSAATVLYVLDGTPFSTGLSGLPALVTMFSALPASADHYENTTNISYATGVGVTETSDPTYGLTRAVGSWAEKGATLVGGQALTRRIKLDLPVASAPDLTTDGWLVVDSGLTWALATPPTPPTTTRSAMSKMRG